MRVLLISANTEEFSMPTMPLGLACVAEAARRAGHAVTMLDLRVGMDAGIELRKTLTDVQPHCIGISVRNIDDQYMESPRFLVEKVKDVVAVCRKQSRAPIVLGGAGYSIFPESVLNYLDADLGIAGEGEIAFPALLSRLEKGADLSGLPGLYVRGCGAKQAKKNFTSLNELSLPSPDLLSASAAKQEDLWIPVQTRRGCSLSCSYCSTPVIEGAILRKRSPELVADWLEKWVKAGYENFFFVDNTFNLPIDYAKEICRQIIERRLVVRAHCIIYPRDIDKELVELMTLAGCRQVSLGFESGSEKILKNLNKGFSVEDIRTASDMFAGQGIERMGFLLLGGPGETRETVEESLNFAESLQLNSLRLTAGIRIYPNTPLAGVAEKEGMPTSEDALFLPRFYLSQGLEGWLLERLKTWKTSRPYAIM